jgi:hypothetical protein
MSDRGCVRGACAALACAAQELVLADALLLQHLDVQALLLEVVDTQAP